MGIDAAIVGAWILGAALSRRLFQDIFTPLCVYVSVWCACLLLFRLRLIAYENLEASTWLLILAATVSFGLGCWLASLKKSRTRNRTLKVTASVAVFRLAILILLLLATTGAILFTTRMASTYGFWTYFSDPSIIRADAPTWTRMGAVGALLLLCYPLFVCSLIDMLATRRIRWSTCLGLVIPVAETYLLTGRDTFITYVICSFFVWAYYTKRRSLDAKTLLVLGGGLVCGVIYFIAVGGLYGKLIEIGSPATEYTTFVPQSEMELRLLTPYIYATGAFPTFQAAMKDSDTRTRGTQLLYPAARVLYMSGVLEREPVAADFDYYLVPIPFNAYTWLFTFYTDFGIYGMLLLPAVVGWGETRIYLRMKEAPTIFSVAASAALAAATALTPFGFIQYDFFLWYLLIVMLFASEISIFGGRVSPAAFRARGAGRISTRTSLAPDGRRGLQPSAFRA